jgi:hypothetical protein
MAATTTKKAAPKRGMAAKSTRRPVSKRAQAQVPSQNGSVQFLVITFTILCVVFAILSYVRY